MKWIPCHWRQKLSIQFSWLRQNTKKKKQMYRQFFVSNQICPSYAALTWWTRARWKRLDCIFWLIGFVFNIISLSNINPPAVYIHKLCFFFFFFCQKANFIDKQTLSMAMESMICNLFTCKVTWISLDIFHVLRIKWCWCYWW